MKRLTTEIEIMKKLKHNNIIQLIEVFDNSADHLYLVMELYVYDALVFSVFLHILFRVRGGELFDKVCYVKLNLVMQSL